MMAAVFLMQPLGQLAACLVGLGAAVGIGHIYGLDKLTNSPTDQAKATAIVDRIWRVVIGVGAFPALVAIIFRITIPESPRFTLDVENDAKRALADAQVYYRSNSILPSPQMSTPLSEWEDSRPPTAQERDSEDVLGWDSAEAGSMPGDRLEHAASEITAASGRKIASSSQFAWHQLRQYFWVECNWRYLAGTSACWFLLDFAFYGLGINNPRTIAGIWDYQSAPTTVSATTTPGWSSDPGQSNVTIYDTLVQDAKQSAITVSIGSVVGSLVLLKAIDYLPRKNFLAWSFIVLATLLAITGGSFFKAFHSNLHAITIVFYVLCQFVFNFGPNTLTFIIPAEIFPTRYRCTCHGISAASGKFGSIIVQLIVAYATFGGYSINDPRYPNLAYILIIFSVLMALGSFFAWAWLPDLQESRRAQGYKLPSKTLEELAGGRASMGEKAISLRNRFGIRGLRRGRSNV